MEQVSHIEQSANVPLIDNQKAQLLTYAQAAQCMQVPLRTLKRWVSLNKVPHKRIGRHVRFYWPHIEAWLQKKEKR